MINNTSVENTHITNGVLATVYPITFQGAVSKSGTPHLNVVLKLPIGSNRQLVYNRDYVLAEVDAVGTEATIGIKLLTESAAALGNTLIITRDTPFTQEKDFQVGRIDPEQLESAEDLAVLRDQELRHQFHLSQEVPEDHEQRIQAAEARLDNIEDKIPEQATVENKLADKAFVNSSIATNTAEFKGTYTSVSDLDNIQDADNNDYAFVISTDALGHTLYNRYKYNETAWVYEYTLNNSSFTAEQWAAINSGVTSETVAKVNNMPVLIKQISVNETTGAITILAHTNITSVSVKKLYGGTVAGTVNILGASATFTPSTVSDITVKEWTIEVA